MQYQPMYGSFGQPPQQQSYSTKLLPLGNKVATSGTNEERMDYPFSNQHSSSSPTNTTATSTSTSSTAASNCASSNAYAVGEQKSDHFSTFRLDSIFFHDTAVDTQQQNNTNVNTTDPFDLRYPTNTANATASNAAINPTFDPTSLPFYRTSEQSSNLFPSFHLSSSPDIIASLANVPIFNEICNFNQQPNNSHISNSQQQEQSNTAISTTIATPSTSSTASSELNNSHTISSLLRIINNTAPTNDASASAGFSSNMTSTPLSNTFTASNNHSNNNTGPASSSSASSSSATSLAAPSSLPPLNTTPIVITPLLNTASKNQTYLLATKKPIKGSPRPFRERAPWTPEEDNLLKLAVQLYGDKTEKWSKIAACVPGRTNKNCRKRWFHSLDPSLRKGTWTEEEDQLLREGVSKFPNQWSKIAELLPGRTDDQCAKRWRESLDPSIDRSEWTETEDKLLMEKYEEYGSQWQKIAYFFDGRPGLHCRNRWRKLQRLSQAKKDKEQKDAQQQQQQQQQQQEQPFKKRMTLERKQNKDGNQSDKSNAMSFCNTLSSGPFRFSNTASATSNSTNPANNNSGHIIDSYQHLTVFLSQPSPSFQQSPRTITQQVNNTLNTVRTTTTSKLNNADVCPSTPEEIHDEHGNVLKPYGCDAPDCQAVFTDSHLLFSHVKRHQSLHGIEKPFRCAMPDCAKKYKNINGLQYHIKEAKGKKCHQGVFVFTTTSNDNGNKGSNLRQQPPSVNSNNNEQQDTIDSSSSNRNEGTSNTAATNDERPYRCNIDNCNKAYRTASGLKYHQFNGHNQNDVKQRQTKGQSRQRAVVLGQQQQQQQQQPPFRFMKRERWVMESA